MIDTNGVRRSCEIELSSAVCNLSAAESSSLCLACSRQYGAFDRKRSLVRERQQRLALFQAENTSRFRRPDTQHAHQPAARLQWMAAHRGLRQGIRAAPRRLIVLEYPVRNGEFFRIRFIPGAVGEDTHLAVRRQEDGYLTPEDFTDMRDDRIRNLPQVFRRRKIASQVIRARSRALRPGWQLRPARARARSVC